MGRSYTDTTLTSHGANEQKAMQLDNMVKNAQINEASAQAGQAGLARGTRDGYAQGVQEGELGMMERLRNYFSPQGNGLAKAEAVDPDLDYAKQMDMINYRNRTGPYSGVK